MQLQVKGKNVKVSDGDRDYAERKLAKLEPQLSSLTQVEVELSEERNHSKRDDHIVEATVYAKGTTIRARSATGDFHTSIDALVDTLCRQIARYRAKRRTEPRRRTTHHA